MEEHKKNRMGVAFNFLNQNKMDGNGLREQILTDDENWIHFYKPERKRVSVTWKKKRKKCQENSRMSGLPVQLMLTDY